MPKKDYTHLWPQRGIVCTAHYSNETTIRIRAMSLETKGILLERTYKVNDLFLWNVATFICLVDALAIKYEDGIDGDVYTDNIYAKNWILAGQHRSNRPDLETLALDARDAIDFLRQYDAISKHVQMWSEAWGPNPAEQNFKFKIPSRIDAGIYLAKKEQIYPCYII